MTQEWRKIGDDLIAQAGEMPRESRTAEFLREAASYLLCADLAQRRETARMSPEIQKLLASGDLITGSQLKGKNDE